MGISELYIEIPIGTLCCFLFLFFSFMNTPGTKSIRSIQLMLLSCILWTGGDLFMRLQLYPGVHFWYSISMFGLLLIPAYVYYFLFRMLDVQRMVLLIVYYIVSIFIGIANACFDIFTTAPQAVSVSKGGIAYLYSTTYGIYGLIGFEVLVLGYVVILAWRKTREDRMVRAKLFPVVAGSCCILLGNFMETVSENKFPYGSMGGTIMAVCLTYLLYREYLFDISKRLLTASVYMVAAVFIFLPIWQISKNIERVVQLLSLPLEETLLILIGGFALWSLLVVFCVIASVKHVEQRQSEKQFEQFQSFQRESLLLFDVNELCQAILRVVPELIRDVDTFLAMNNEVTGDYEVVNSISEEILGKSQDEIEKEFDRLASEKQVKVAPIRYDGLLKGYLCLKPKGRRKLNYQEEECFQQLAAHTSICLKNIHIFQRRYQMAIHDDLTGLYSRRYFKEFMDKHWVRGAKKSVLYLDVDNFKLFNELYGESCGDDILKWCGQVIKNTVSSAETVFRMGSNEYLVYVSDAKKEKMLHIAREIQENLKVECAEKPKVLQPITMSIGIATYTSEAASADELLKQAERALFFAKQKGKNCIEVYGEEEVEKNNKLVGATAYEQISSTVYALTAAINAKDSYTFAHSMHVSQYAVLLAKEIGLNRKEVQIVKEAGLLHDIGKIGIPENILQKAGKLTDEEYEIMKSHVTKSVEMIHFLPNMNYVIPAVLSHHERYDGRGYPRGLAGEEIPLQGRILAVCDCYDAMVSKRSYKEAFSVEYAIDELKKNRGTQFDPDLVDVFVTLIPHLEKSMEEKDKAG